MKSDKSKKKIVPKSNSDFDSLKPKKKMGPDKKSKVSIKSPKFWEEIDDEETSYRIKGM
ncbi:MAG: hypothetical protein IPL23_24860 [Saprospiraceae bacterium]|nr:hypothetical protein [Saprospiraceae bacterium]MBK8633774.1 hypothetical protein [Saprospiraceae bacterium]MBP7643201.1 hypothetical protein [Saprospiraceae bacterium]HMS68036.1 hypothetical protein [Saprospiraceae bacterium]HOY12906.1 hypothetical protein [Saprospiraceae bacterium]